MSSLVFFKCLVVMALVTYLIRAVPFAMFNRKIKSRFVRSFLEYVPFAVLSAMTIPDIFFATDMLLSSVVALLVAVALAYKEKSLLTVAVFSCVSVYVTEFITSILK